MVAAALLAVCLILAGGSEARAQADRSDPSASVAPASGALELDLSGLLADGGLRGALHSGLPVRVEIRVELWRDGTFDRQVGGETWRASIIHDAVTRSYELRIGSGQAETLPSLARVAQAVAAGLVIEVRPEEPGRYYYLADVEMQTLSLSDLEELRRWLQGDLGAAIRGEESGESAVARGLRRLVVRALGLPARRERLRTPSFTWPPDEPPGP